MLKLHISVSKIVLNFSPPRPVHHWCRKVSPDLTVVKRDGTHQWIHTEAGMAARWNPFDTSQLPPGALLLSKLDSKLITNLSRSVVPVTEIYDLLTSGGS